MRNTLYDLIRNNRNNSTQEIQIGFTERFSKPEEVLNDRDLFDPATGIIHRRVQYIFQQIEKLKIINIMKVMFLPYIIDQVLGDY